MELRAGGVLALCWCCAEVLLCAFEACAGVVLGAADACAPEGFPHACAVCSLSLCFLFFFAQFLVVVFLCCLSAPPEKLPHCYHRTS